MSDVPVRLATALADRYRLERELGHGGMATVYLAHDVKHDRKVAVKVLRSELAAVLGAERFLNEIRVTANLQHPHILALYDSGEADGFLFYVMPYVDGEPLDARLKREKQLGIEDAVRMAGEMASALDYAHRQGVVHRDIKPANVLLQDGQVLVADFGIALALKAAGGDRLTETGLSLGTPHYMSPEQATGDRDVDARTDVYALGAVLYEMLAGEPPHTGNSIQAILSRVLTETPRPLMDLRNSVPAHVAMAVEKALAKVPADRFASAADFAQALRDPGFTLRYSALGTRRSAVGGGTKAQGRGPKAALLAAAAALLLALGALGGRITTRQDGAEPLVARFRIPVESERGLTGAPVNTLALSPDGRTIVYVARASGGALTQLYARRLSDLDAHPVTGTEGASFPAFSPDGQRLAYVGVGGAYVVALSGGVPTAIAGASQALAGIVWLDDWSIVATDEEGRVTQVGLDGSTRALAAPDSASGERNLFPLVVLPGGRHILAVASGGAGQIGRILAIDARRGERTVLIEEPTNAVWYADGCLLWAQASGALLAAPFDPNALRLTGPPVTVATGVRQAVGGSAQAAVSATGSMVYLPEQPFNLMLIERDGRREVVGEGRRFHSPRFAPDGRRLAVDFVHQGSRDVWLLDLRQRTTSRLSFEHDGHDPVWSPDGRWILYVSGNGIWRRRSDGSGTPESLYVRASITSALEVLPGGARVLTASVGAGGAFDISLLSIGETTDQTPLLATPFVEEAATLSPNGAWLAYTSDETGRNEIYVRPFPEGGAKVLASQGGGTEARWSRDGRTLYYLGLHERRPFLIAASVVAGNDFTVAARTPLFEVTEFEPSSPHSNYDLSPDGTRFAMVHQGPLSEMIFVLNWTEEVRRRSADGAPRSGGGR